MSKLLTRTISGAVYVILFVGAIYCGRITGNKMLGTLVLKAFLLFVTIGGTFEYFRMIEKKGDRPNRWIGYLMAALSICSIPVFSIELPILLMLLAMATLISELWRGGAHPFANAAHTMLPTAYIAIPFAWMQNLNEFGVLMMVVLLTWVNDSFAYLGGSLVGKHKLWVRHSPGKTWEGCICGLVGNIAVATLCGPLFKAPLSRPEWIAIGLIVSIIGTLGDLVESMLKRSCDVKDSGNIMPGHGGFLDRFDSLLAIVPFVYAFLLIINK